MRRSLLATQRQQVKIWSWGLAVTGHYQSWSTVWLEPRSRVVWYHAAQATISRV